jgi:hypothetical protein
MELIKQYLSQTSSASSVAMSTHLDYNNGYDDAIHSDNNHDDVGW